MWIWLVDLRTNLPAWNGSGDKWSAYIQQANFPVKLNLNLQKDIIFQLTPHHLLLTESNFKWSPPYEDEHSPSDTADKLNFPASQSALNYLQTLS